MSYTEEEINLITLESFEELYHTHISTLLSNFKSAEPDFEKYRDVLIKSLDVGVYNKVKAKFYSKAYRDKILQKLDERNIICVTYFSKLYPEQLRQTPCPPVVLFCKGKVELLQTRMFAVVGSRKTLPVMIKECKQAASELTQAFTVVTGMADGADAAAIEGALASGKIISVLAYGFDHVYPSVNAGLLKQVAEKGLLVTEYTPQVEPRNYNFPVRNRIIAGLSEAVLVVSAGQKSGALITAKYADEYSRSVYAFPYTKGVSSGEGCNILLKSYKAKLIECAEDIFNDLNIKFEARKEVELTEDEKTLYKLIKETGEAFAPLLAEKLGKLPFQIIPILTALEIKGVIVRLGGNRFSAT